MTEHNNPAGPAANKDTLRAELANALHDDWCGCDSWDGVNCEGYHEGEFPESADAALAVVVPVLERQAGEIADHWRAADVDEGTKADLAEENISLIAEVARLTRERDEARAQQLELDGMAVTVGRVVQALAKATGLPVGADVDVMLAEVRRLASRSAITAEAGAPGVVNHIRPVKVSADRVEVEVSTRVSDGTTRAYVREWGRKGGCRQVGLILTDEKRAELVARLSAPVSGSDTATDAIEYCKVEIWPTWANGWVRCGSGFGADGRCWYGHSRPAAPASPGGSGATATDGGDRG